MKILYFSPIPYHDLFQRPQHIAKLLSENHTVYFVEPTISLMKYLIKGGESFKRHEFDISPSLKIKRAGGAFTLHRSLEQIIRCNPLSEARQLSHLARECDIIWTGHPSFWGIIKKLPPKPLYYDKMDEDTLITTNPLLKKLFARYEREIIKAAKAIFVTAEVFSERIKPQNPNTYLVSNGVERSFIGTPLPKETQSDARVYGYIGTMGHWFDNEAIRTILDADPRNRVMLAGPCFTERLSDSRVTYMGSLERSELPLLLSRFDVCLYTFSQSELLDTINPVKLYEYLAANRPVIAVKSRETSKLAEYLNLYKDYDELSALCSHDLEPPFKNEEERKAFMKKNSWESRILEIERILSLR